MKKVARRGLGILLAGVGLASLGACGFQPLYGRQAGQKDAAVNAQLKDVYVANIPTRFGQELRLGLQKEMAGDGPERPEGYILRVNATASLESIDIHQDNTSGRTRGVGWADWRLYRVGDTSKVLARGYARTLDGFNMNIEQYFAQTLNNETLYKRIGESLAHDITMQVAVWFRAHQSLGEEKSIRPGRDPYLDRLPGTQRTDMRYIGVDGFPANATGRSSNNASTWTGEDSRNLEDEEDNGL
ncbi:hypothetical protein CO583_06430 [Parasaccharibacter sp. TMW2.1882]|nr:hypothetical protein [Bombella apis]MCK8637154.1 hypothetical protein [Parasaccharibacter sp. TMW2.1885]MCL1497145.1 hypothetical protein [Parasaccharibacter sp. TMW2.1882]MCL1512434.1 hypothetical protein [Parasaccharibacter sp. TMW 2.1884]MCL1513860.1 hypothetical protein [Parasaccharibacter sp. TMW 2.1891]MCL1515414.1 hypothetical protein [Parasaccharibacter sp. TMW2.1890]MCL1562448.1 hypothetical protein [Parasaccharibacter sp. TMW 2.1886]MUG79855.1 hypothetical protein [Bombella sp. 